MDVVPILVVQVGGQRCGLVARDVKEVLHAVSITALPGAPPGVDGVINVRGTVVPVFDLRPRFGLASRPLIRHDRLAIVHCGDRDVAVRVDHALDLVTVSSTELDEAPTLGSDGGNPTAVVRLPDGLVVICDPATLISGDEAIVLDELLAGASPA